MPANLKTTEIYRDLVFLQNQSIRNNERHKKDLNDKDLNDKDLNGAGKKRLLRTRILAAVGVYRVTAGDSVFGTEKG